MMTNDDNLERFYGRGVWLVTNDTNDDKKVYIKTPIMDIVDKLPRNDGIKYKFTKVERAEAKTEPVVSTVGMVNIEIDGLDITDIRVKEYFERRYGKVVIKDNHIEIDASDNNLADNAKEKLTAEEYDYLVKHILAENGLALK